jgi:hypothetical protein
MKERLWEAVIGSNRWVKWIRGAESASDFYSISAERQEWLIKTGCRYIWENPEVIAARQKLFHNLDAWGIQSEEIVLSGINRAMDRYFHSFNLLNLTEQL